MAVMMVLTKDEMMVDAKDMMMVVSMVASMVSRTAVE